MNPEKHGAGAAWRMLLSFAALGVQHFDLTRTGLDGRLRAFYSALSLPALRRWLPSLLPSALDQRHNLILRPRSAAIGLIQLDDLDAATLERVRSDAFLVLATSPGNHQAWLAVRPCPPGLARRLRQATGADPCASGAVRLAGSLNCKPRYAPRFPLVELLECAPGRIVSPAELETKLGLPAAAPPPSLPPPGSAPKRWPSYQRCLDHAPRAHHRDRPDVSRADFTFCLIAMDWGWPVDETARCLLELSPKARARGQRYASLTAQRAAQAVQRRRAWPPASN